ncbi:hypothetical protein H0H92_015038 [Tricholoma furcatifolium]|nr:hypothetical protein H0H92_015038 [Tricholoma furcatifolium]
MRVALTRPGGKLDGEDIYAMAFALKAPQDDETGDLVKESLIPFIQSIRTAKVILPPIRIAVVRDRDTYGFRDLIKLKNHGRMYEKE